MKVYPQLDKLRKIQAAGIQIDDILHNTQEQMRLRSCLVEQQVDLIEWLSHETELLKNQLKIKHSCKLEFHPGSVSYPVTVYPLLLGVLLEQVILTVIDSSEPGGSIPLNCSIRKENGQCYVSLQALFSQSVGLEIKRTIEMVNRAFSLYCEAHQIQVKPMPYSVSPDRVEFLISGGYE